MVKVKENALWSSDDDTIDLDAWLSQLSQKGYLDNLDLLRNAFMLSHLAGGNRKSAAGFSCLRMGLMMVDVLADLSVDHHTLAAALLYESAHYAELSLEDIEEQIGILVAKLVYGIEKMSALDHMMSIDRNTHNRHHLDNMRKMLLAMVDDPRVVLIKLAERLCMLRVCNVLAESTQRHLAAETMAVYAPLANRLGIGAIKWELEDLSFRHLHPAEYQSIAKGLKNKRLERDRYVNLIVDELNNQIKRLNIGHFAVYGRSKHIHSIYRKMMRKNVPLEAIYDATAVRILVETKEQCYLLLAMVHDLWHQIPAEFDDYILNIKANGYQSLHTAVLGPDNRIFEVQIRTFTMHELAEMGLAAHWKYKEGAITAQESHDRKILWLRDVLAWHREMATTKGNIGLMESEFLEDRVYIFTPDGDVLDLPKGVTPLDFAYHVHSQVGHCCRGAKVNAEIVPLTYTLKTGDRVEILTGKEARPSRDWINPHLNYLKTSRAKAKVLHWFKMQNQDVHCAQGKELLHKELKLLGIKLDQIHSVLENFNFKKIDDLYIALGRGDLKITQILNKLPFYDAPHKQFIPQLKATHVLQSLNNALLVEGVGNLVTHFARCCKPLPQEDVIGYMTLGRGVSIHRKDCVNILQAQEKQHARFLQVSWTNTITQRYPVELLIKAFDRPNLLKDITTLLSNEFAHINTLQSSVSASDNISTIKLQVDVTGLNNLSRLLTRLRQIPNIIDAMRYID